MKFLLHGNAPDIKTGYGVQLALLGEMLKADGHDVAFSATYGQQGSVRTWNGYRVYGCGYDANGNDLIHQHANHWFGRDKGWLITCVDVWALTNPILADWNVAAWTPVDHFLPTGVQPGIHEFFEMSNAVPLAMSQFAMDMLRRRGHDPLYVPLSVDTQTYKPTPFVEGETGSLTGRQMLELDEGEVPEDAFVVGMVAMNKGWAKDRKGFNEAFRAFGIFERTHPEANAHLYVHSENLGGAEGINLLELAVFSGIAPHKIHWAGGRSQYSYRLGFTNEMMAACYTAFDVLLAPSHGEGFCVPLIEAHACGTPVIATDFSAQTELVPEGTGWLVEGQPEWDPPHHAEYKQPYIADIVMKLEDAYEADRAAMTEACIAHAAQYDTRYVYETWWKPAIAELTQEQATLELDREPMPELDAVAVLCPIHDRRTNVDRLIRSFRANTEPGEATLYLVSTHAEPKNFDNVSWITDPATTCGDRWNVGFERTTEPWVLCIGDDVQFHAGWLDAARKLSGEFDVIGTNDTADKVKNPKVANGTHADHFFIRRAYIDRYGASLDGPGVLASPEYHHWFTDKEIIGLARARGVFTPCLDSVVEHLHPGYDGREDLRQADSTYMAAVEWSADDQATFANRAPLIEQARTTRERA